MKPLLSTSYVIITLLMELTACSLSEKGSAKNTSVTIPAQNVNTSMQTTSSKALKVTRESGWEIPSLKQSRVTRSRQTLSNKNDEPVQIYWTWLEPQQESLLDTSSYLPEELKVLRLESGVWSVTRVIEYDVDERKFCYVILIHPQNAGALSALHYYDEDGDGNFETVERGNAHFVSFIPRIPQWVK
jgi:hypothetical protein